MTADVVVVGAGVVGSATAYELARRGVDVALVEREAPGFGASGRNPGYLWSHTRAEGSQLELGLAGRARYDTLVEELDDFEFRGCGGMIYYFEHQHALFPAFVANRRAAGIPMELLDAAEARTRCPILPEDIGGATWNPLDAHVDPARLVEALITAAQRHGAKVRSGARGVELDAAGGRCHGVRLDSGGIGADAVVVAAGAWSPRLLEPLGLPLPIEPMRLQMVETEPIQARFEPVLYGPTGVKQYALTKDLDGYAEEDFTHPLETILSGVELLELAAQRRDGRVLMGCPMDFAGLDDRPTVGGIGLTLGVLGDHLPALSAAAVERVWGGLLPQTPDALPVLGPVRDVDGLILASGHVFGMLAGPVSGLLVAQAIVGEPSELDLAPFRYEREVISGAPERQALRQW
jgi:glycine/D-amino acid oxidase-like deaminating enzyme